MFSIAGKKWNFETIVNSAYIAVFLILRRALIQYPQNQFCFDNRKI